MINIIDKKDCNGCCACVDVCPVGAINLKTDVEGFWYPAIDVDVCVNCSLCDRICPELHADSLKKNEFEQAECYAAIHNNLEIRFDSTSGGLFSAFAEYIYKEGGYVGGAIFNPDFSVKHFISSDKKDLEHLRSSKYLQSNASGFYKTVKSLLAEGEKVLVCGTPCQMAALRSFLGSDYENLFIIDFICLGVNSPKIFRKYLDYLERRFASKVVYFKAKNKELGWRELTSKISFENGTSFFDTKSTSPFTIGYLHTRVFCRPSCYECKFKGYPRIADLTIADFWGAENFATAELDNDLGTSLVMVNNSKGENLFRKINNKILFEKIPFEVISKKNRALIQSIPKPIVNREEFYRKLDTSDFEDIANEYIYTKQSAKARLKKRLLKYFLVIKYTGFRIRPLYQLFRYNKFKSLFNTDGLLIPDSYCCISIKRKANCILNGILYIGQKKMKTSRLETRLCVDEGGMLNVDGNFTFGYGSNIEVFKGGKLEIKDGGATNIGATIICANHIYIGKRVMMGRNVTIRDNNGGHFINRRGYKDSRPVIIGDRAWLCEGCTIMPGVKIGEGAIIGAHSLVTRNVPANVMVSGNPAVVVDEDVLWKY